jgi:molybdopterin-guanine dinucleotide biosynthesis protein A
MGQDKALLPYDATTFLAHTLTRLQTLTPDIIVVADIADKYVLPAGRVVADIFPDAGPVGGILTGLTYAGEGWHYLVACDMPALQLDVLRALMQAATDDDNAVVPEREGHSEPLCAVYCHTAVPKLHRFLAEGGRAARQALKALNVRRVIWEETLRPLDPDAQSFININTLEELTAFREGRDRAALGIKGEEDSKSDTWRGRKDEG